jgi:hypothetical protein
MNTIQRSSFVLAICLVCSVAWPQYQGPVRSGQERKGWAEPPEQRTAIQLSNTPDPRELKRDAEQLAQLSQTIPAEVEAMRRGLVSSNLNDRLKRIEKLSKKLRDAVARSNR